MTCPLCTTDLSTMDVNGAKGHVFTHLDDRIRRDPSSGLQLQCGCPEARWDSGDDFTDGTIRHLERVHGLRL